ncbi:hypothetical protein [Aestuariivivens sediminicola]|uniref:Arm DNA-binding domain-containing protein n=1 Tax=Aestuariivivens sediminicola TaxID=2913560 RepID=UPI0030D87BD1
MHLECTLSTNSKLIIIKPKTMKLSIRFYLDKSKINKRGQSSIKCRITYNKIRKEFSTGCVASAKCLPVKE